MIGIASQKESENFILTEQPGGDDDDDDDDDDDTASVSFRIHPVNALVTVTPNWFAKWTY